MENKWILLTGGTGAIGKVTADYLYENNYNLVIVGRNLEKINKLFLNYSKERYLLLELDIDKLENIKSIFDTILLKVGKLDGFVNCVGIQEITSISMLKIKKIKEMFEINIFLVFQLLKYFSKEKYVNKGASIVLLSSIACLEGAIGNSFYAASKGCLEGALKSFAAEFGNNRRINLISPGVIEGGMGNKYCENLSEEQLKNLKKSYPLGIGKEIDVAYMIEYLLSEKSKWITGQNFILDGGHLSYMK